MHVFVMLLSLYGESNFLNYNNRSCANTMGIYTCVQGILNMADKTAGQLESTLHVNKGAFEPRTQCRIQAFFRGQGSIIIYSAQNV